MQRHSARLRPQLSSTPHRRGQHRALTLAFVLTALGSSACDEGEPNELEDTAAAVEHVANDDEVVLADDVEIVVDQPDLVLELGGGAKLGFFIDDDGIAMMEEIPQSAHIASVLDDPWLADASPAVVWYALTKDGTEIPEPLRSHHENLAAAGEVEPLAEALTGQVRNLAPVPLADEESPCLNATFDVNHCDHPDYDHTYCKFNTGASWLWNVPEAHRYKAGFCLQTGEARSWLYYSPGAGSDGDECLYFKIAHYVWGYDSDTMGVRYQATTYRSYVWWGGPGELRYFSHRGIGDPGSVYDYGNRYTHGSCL